MKRSQRLTAVFLILFMLCGCSAPAAPNPAVLPQTPAETCTEPAPVSAEPAQAEPETETFYLEYEQTALPEPLLSVTALSVLDGAILLGGFSESGLALVRLTPDGRSEELPLPGSTEYLYALCPDGAGGAWLLCGSLPKGYADAYGNFTFLDADPEGRLALAHYDAAFALQEVILLQTQYTERFSQMYRLGGGFCLMSAPLLVRLDETGAETARQSLDTGDGWRFAGMQETDGVLYALTRNFYGEELPELRKFAPDTLSALEAETCTSKLTGFGLCADGRLLLGNSEEVFAYNTSSGEAETLVQWRELGANVTAEQLWELADGYLLFTPDDTSLHRLRRVPGQAPERTVLTLAVVCGDTPLWAFTQMLKDFNLSQDTYRIDWTFYTDSQYADGEPADLLRTALIAGQGPDLFAFYTNGYNPVPLVPEDVCADLLPLMGGEITRETLLPGLYDLMESDGALYQLPLTVSVDTLIAPSRLIPEPGVTFAGFEQARSRMPDGWVPIGSWNTPGNLFHFCVPFCIGAYTDRAAGTCDFETQGFYDCLAWCKTWGGDGSTPEEQETTLVKLTSIRGVDQLAGRSEYVEKNWFGEPGYTYAGFPTQSGSGSAYQVLTSLGLGQQCSDPDGAKAFLEFCFSYSQDGALPADFKRLQAELAAYQSADPDSGAETVSEADAAQFNDLLDGITVLAGLDGQLTGIIQEEAAGYFAGSMTAEQAARNIQSRARIYLQERRRA